jgi:hypothetical protein
MFLGRLKGRAGGLSSVAVNQCGKRVKGAQSTWRATRTFAALKKMRSGGSLRAVLSRGHLGEAMAMCD